MWLILTQESHLSKQQIMIARSQYSEYTLQLKTKCQPLTKILHNIPFIYL